MKKERKNIIAIVDQSHGNVSNDERAGMKLE